MTTDLEEVLSTQLHREAAELVPDVVPAMPVAPRSRFRLLSTGPGSRWRAPVLVAAAVLIVAVTTTVAVQSQRGTTASPATGSHASPVLDSHAASFPCMEVPTVHAAATRIARIGITADLFCVNMGNGRSGGTSLRPSGALRALLSTEALAAGAVAPSVDRVVFVPRGGDEKSGVTEDLYALGSLRSFAFPLTGGGTLLLYSGSAEVARQSIPFPGEDTAVASSSAAATLYPATAPASINASGADGGPVVGGALDSTQAIRSYPPGEGPTPRPGVWPTNARGQTYGSDAHANAETGEPNLIAAYATNGKQGYVVRTDLELPPPKNISEAVAQNTMGPRTIPVYLSDGVTQIGVLVLQ